MKHYCLFMLLVSVAIAGCVQPVEQMAIEANDTETQTDSIQTETSISTIFPTNTSIPTGTPTQTATATVEPTAAPTSTSTSTPTLSPYRVEVSIFHDLNGNEMQDSGEPPVSGAIVEAADTSCTTGTEGMCQLEYVPPGSHQLHVDTSNAHIVGLRYLFFDREVLNPSNGPMIDVEADTTVQLALGQGPFTISIAAGSFQGLSYGFGDLHEMNGELVPHAGLDIEIRGDGPQPIYAPVSGQAKPEPDGTWGECNHVTIWYTGLGLELGVGMGHLTDVVAEPYAQVKKGDLIGHIDPTIYPGWAFCTYGPHIHYNIWGNIPGETWPHEDSGLPWEILPAGEWGWLDPEKFLPMTDNPLPMFASIEDAENYSRR